MFNGEQAFLPRPHCVPSVAPLCSFRGPTVFPPRPHCVPSAAPLCSFRGPTFFLPWPHPRCSALPLTFAPIHSLQEREPAALRHTDGRTCTCPVSFRRSPSFFPISNTILPSAPFPLFPLPPHQTTTLELTATERGSVIRVRFPPFLDGHGNEGFNQTRRIRVTLDSLASDDLSIDTSKPGVWTANGRPAPRLRAAHLLRAPCLVVLSGDSGLLRIHGSTTANTGGVPTNGVRPLLLCGLALQQRGTGLTSRSHGNTRK